jgi:hypothetical protein
VRRAREQGLSLTGPDGLLKQLTKTVLETALNQELTEHLGHDKHGPATSESGNVRNGTRGKTVLTEATGQVGIEVPREVYAAVFIDAIMVKVRVLSLILWRGGWVRPPTLRDHAPGAVSMSCCHTWPRCALRGCTGSRTGWCSRPGFVRRGRLAGIAGGCRGGCTAATCASCGMLRSAACRW